MRGLLALTAATSILILAGCSAGGGSEEVDPGSSVSDGPSATSIDEPATETAVCPEPLTAAQASEDTREVDGTAIDEIIAGGMTYAPSCAFETTDSSGDVTELVFYITDDTAGVLKYIADSYAANDIAAGTEAGTWDVEDATVKAVVGSPADDPKNNPLVGAAYVVLTDS